MLVTIFPILALISEAVIGGEQESSFAISRAACLDVSISGGVVRAQAMLIWNEDDRSSDSRFKFDGDCGCVVSLL